MEDRAYYERRLGSSLRGKWKLERLLGVGGMAAVYAARHKIGRLEAIKILHPEVARSQELAQRFEREAHAVNRLQHKGVVEIRDIDVAEDGCPFLVMEFLEGETLGEKARREQGIDPPLLLRYVDDLLDVLKVAHAEGIIHRDIKLDNLFITKDGELKVLDFGVARMREGSRGLLTKIGATLGTVAYMPPEQVSGRDIDARADLFAIGATMFRLLAKRRLHEARSEAELLVKMATEPAPALASVAPQVPAALAAVVDRALAFDRNDRYASAEAMQTAVRSVRQDESALVGVANAGAGDLGLDRTETAGGEKTSATAATVAGPALMAEPTAATRHDDLGPMSGAPGTRAAATRREHGVVPIAAGPVSGIAGAPMSQGPMSGPAISVRELSPGSLVPSTQASGGGGVSSMPPAVDATAAGPMSAHAVSAYSMRGTMSAPVAAETDEVRRQRLIRWAVLSISFGGAALLLVVLLSVGLGGEEDARADTSDERDDRDREDDDEDADDEDADAEDDDNAEDDDDEDEASDDDDGDAQASGGGDDDGSSLGASSTSTSGAATTDPTTGGRPKRPGPGTDDDGGETSTGSTVDPGAGEDKAEDKGKGKDKSENNKKKKKKKK